MADGFLSLLFLSTVGLRLVKKGFYTVLYEFSIFKEEVFAGALD